MQFETSDDPSAQTASARLTAATTTPTRHSGRQGLPRPGYTPTAPGSVGAG